MGRAFEQLSDPITAFVEQQHVFFVATAPAGADGHVNLSPKGHDTFRVLDPTTVAYVDLTGSGVETIAHLRENGRITLMFCAFEGPPNIVRLYGRGEVLTAADDGFHELLGTFGEVRGARAVVRVALDRVSTSCGFSIPFMTYESERPTLLDWAERKGADGLEAYVAEKNGASIDGLAGLP
jgi:hypothetical protein